MLIERLVNAMADAIAHHAPELTELDRDIGDADHGTNMQRGFEALRRAHFEWDGAAPCDALERAGMTLVTSVGGAAGPLYGSFLLGMARAAAGGAGLVDQIGEGVACVKRRGRVEAGAKTLVDVLDPVLEALRTDASIAELRRVSDRACIATRDMIATRGRAAYLGERARGHVDPGAASSRLLIHAICDVLEEGPWPR